MKRKSIPLLHEPTEAEIQHAAYLLWVEDGQPEGRDLDHWLAAKEIIRHRRSHAAHRRGITLTPLPPDPSRFRATAKPQSFPS